VGELIIERKREKEKGKRKKEKAKRTSGEERGGSREEKQEEGVDYWMRI